MGQDSEDGESQNQIEMRKDDLFDALKVRDIRNEHRIFWSELAILLACGLLIAIYLFALAVDRGTAQWLSW